MILIVLILITQLLCTNSFSTPHGRHDFQSTRFNLIPRLRHSQSSSSNNESNEPSGGGGIRLNKVFKATHSRREADKLIESGRVSVNGEPLLNKGGIKVVPFRDVVTLDGKVIHGWEKMNAINENNVDTNGNHHAGENLQTSSFEYVKYFKPLGVTCTTDLRIKGNIIESIGRDGYNPRHRVYPVGRLDKETSGLIVLTSDGRMVNAVLRGEKKQPKVYKVMVNGPLEEEDLQRLRDGIVITTVTQRKGRSEEENTLVARTKNCKVERIGPSSCQMTLVEGRNRQIRKMMQALGFRVVKLHRIEFMGIHLTEGLKFPGDWAHLDEGEMELVENALRLAQEDS